jgi:hypothetical protein
MLIVSIIIDGFGGRSVKIEVSVDFPYHLIAPLLLKDPMP